MKKHKYYFRNQIKKVTPKILNLKFYKIFKKNILISKSLRQRVLIKKFKIYNKYNVNRLKKYCIITGKLRFVIHNHKYSRSVFRELCSFGLISGIYKK